VEGRQRRREVTPMAEATAIQWTDHTWNLWRGCTKISPGCAHCYAERLANRNPALLGKWGAHGSRVLAAADQWKQPAKWDRAAAKRGVRARVFCASLADVFDDWPGQMTGPDGRELFTEDAEPYTLAHARAWKLWPTIRATPHLDWQLLTKRPENIPRMMPAGRWGNVWLGTSVESADYLWRVDALLEAADRVEVPVRFVSAEPLLSAVDFGAVLHPDRVNWMIVGGESGGKARNFDLAWGRSIVRQCRAAGVACFVKQVGARPVEMRGPGVLWLHLGYDPKGGDPADWPADLCVREFPAEVVPGVCVMCGCTDADCRGCIERTGRRCEWVAPSLCSACAPAVKVREG